ncbi:MAG: LEPR-XLL domain-containing protein [Planctomycetes bacterium]|nr:LEPR-XLL domain-containing protein [Planctomycetota bacterium]
MAQRIDGGGTVGGPHLETLEPRVLLSGAPDLTAALVDPRIPAATVSGDGTPIVLPVVVANDGDAALDRRQRIDLAVVARPLGGGDDVAVRTFEGLLVGGLRPGAGKRLMCKVTLPAGMETGQYVLVVRVDSGGAVAESDETNNEAASAAIGVTRGEVDLVGQAVRCTLPPALVAGAGARGAAQFVVANDGNIAVARGRRADIALVLRPDGGGEDIPLRTLTGVPLGGLRAGAGRRLTAVVQIPASVTAGQYDLVALIDAADDVPDERHEDNNDAVLADAIAVAASQVNLTAAVADPSIPAETISGQRARLAVPVTVTNGGDMPLPRGQRIDLTIAARLVGGGGETVLRTFEGVPVGGLRAGAARRFTLAATLPEAMAAGEYTLIVHVDSGGDVAESDETDNTAEHPGTWRVTPPLADLVAAPVAGDFPAEILSGRIYAMSDTVTNTGGYPVGQTRLACYLSVDARLSADDLLLGERVVGPLAPGESDSGETDLNTAGLGRPFHVSRDAFVLVVVDAGGDVDEGAAGEANNVIAYPTTFMLDNQPPIGPIIISGPDGVYNSGPDIELDG